MNDWAESDGDDDTDRSAAEEAEEEQAAEDKRAKWGKGDGAVELLHRAEKAALEVKNAAKYATTIGYGKEPKQCADVILFPQDQTRGGSYRFMGVQCLHEFFRDLKHLDFGPLHDISYPRTPFSR